MRPPKKDLKKESKNAPYYAEFKYEEKNAKQILFKKFKTK